MNLARSIVALYTLSVAACAYEATPDEQVGSTAEALLPSPKSRHPIVFAHGFSASSARKNPWSFATVTDELNRSGYVAYAAQVSPYMPVPERAAELALEVNKALALCRTVKGCDASKVHIVAHSQGGLDARYLASKLGYGSKIASITTVGTPHHGTRVADALVAALLPLPVSQWVNCLASKWSVLFTDPALAAQSDVLGALGSLSVANAASQNRQMPAVPGIAYRSFAGVSFVGAINHALDPDAKRSCEGKFAFGTGARDPMAQAMWATASIAGGLMLDPNDGIATVESQKLPAGHPGRFMGCIPADHLDEVARTVLSSDNPAAFDPIAFYKDVASKLDTWVAEDKK